MVLSYANLNISENNLQRFRAWVLARGRVPGTADLYVTHLRLAAADHLGLTHRVIAGELAPNTIHGVMASLRAWAMFSKDKDLSDILEDVRLPPARRVRRKLPLARDQWRSVIRQIQTYPLAQDRLGNDAMRQVLLIMALRGMRSGDILRLKKTEIRRALDSGKLSYEGKGRKRMEFTVAPIRGPLQALSEHPGSWERVRDLVSRSSNPKVASVRVWRAAKRTARQAGIPDLNPHRFRHTFATMFLGELAGDPNAIVKLQKHMGWENVATAARYVDEVSQDHLDEIGARLVGDLAQPAPMVNPARPRKRRRS
jgi:integrase